MTKERTLTFLKPDVFENNHCGDVLSLIEKAGFKILAAKMVKLTEAQAKKFYAVHSGKPFLEDLVKYVTRGPVMALVLEGQNAIARYRELMGATDPRKADSATLRGKFGKDMDSNVVHGSDSVENAAIEIPLFFSALEIVQY